MAYKRLLACFISAAVAMGLTACKNDDELKEYSEMMAADDMVISTGVDPTEESEKETEEISGTEVSTVSTSLAAESTLVSTLSSNKSSSVTTTKKAASTTRAAGNASIMNSNNNNSSKNNNSNKNNNNNSNGGSASTSKTTAAQTTVHIETTTEPIAPEDVDKYVDFGSGQINGDGCSFDGSVLNIFSPGTYNITGQLYGLIYVNVGNEDKVKLKLNGVSIENTGAPCIQVDNADKVTVHAVSGSSNYIVCSATNEACDAAIFSKDDLKVKGEGSLFVSCDNEHGISCNNDLEISECQLTVDAEKTGINCHKSIVIRSGNIVSNGDNCGIRCRDYIEISDGIVTACGGKKTGADRGGIISDTGNFLIQGGTVTALGMNQTIPNGQMCALFTFPEDIPKENTLGVSVNGLSIASVTPNKKYRCVLVSSPAFGFGAVCDVWLNGSHYDNFELTDIATQSALDGVC